MRIASSARPAWDCASARVFEEAGFAAIGTTSAGIAYSQGFRDAERIGRDAMVRAASIPVAADHLTRRAVRPDAVRLMTAHRLGG